MWRKNQFFFTTSFLPLSLTRNRSLPALIFCNSSVYKEGSKAGAITAFSLLGWVQRLNPQPKVLIQPMGQISRGRVVIKGLAALEVEVWGKTQWPVKERFEEDGEQVCPPSSWMICVEITTFSRFWVHTPKDSVLSPNMCKVFPQKRFSVTPGGCPTIRLWHYLPGDRIRFYGLMAQFYKTARLLPSTSPRFKVVQVITCASDQLAYTGENRALDELL